MSVVRPEVSGEMLQDKHLFQVGEELTYNVSYASFDIGQVRIKLVEKISEKGRAYYKATAHIDSYKGVPFVSLHSIYESHIDDSLYSHWFRSRIKKDSDWHFFTYDFNYPEKSLKIEGGTWSTGKVQEWETFRLESYSQDGLSFFYYARALVLSHQSIDVPTVVSEKKGMTSFNFLDERTKEKIEAVDYPVDVVQFEGNAKFVGIFGLTGDFEGWFSNDHARVPILAKMKVLIGNIRIELMKWDRKNWTPPRYHENEGE